MAEIVASAVASEAVSRISSLVSGDKTSTPHQSAEDRAERLEMAVLKIQSIVAVSEDLHITHLPLPLVRWKAKLKRVAAEGDSLLHVHKKKIQERSTTTSSTLSRHFLVHAAKRLVPFNLRRGGAGGREEEDEKLSDGTLRRFERLADGADSFFRLVAASSSTSLKKLPSLSPPLPSLTRSLLAGNSVEFCLGSRPPGNSSSDLVLLWPWRDPDAEDEDELEAYLMVAREDVVTWQRNLKMLVSFRLSAAANVLAIAMSCLDMLPPQFSATRNQITGLLHQTIASASSQSDQWRRSRLSALSMWCRRTMRDYLRSGCGPPHDSDNQECTNSGTMMMVLPQPVIRFTTFCYALPAAMEKSCDPLNNSNGGVPLKMACHVSPYFLPEKHSSQFLQVEQNGILETMLPKVEEGFYDDDERQALVEYRKEIWCPQSAMYCSVAPEITQPLTLSKAYLMENSTAPINRRKRLRKSHAMSK